MTYDWTKIVDWELLEGSHDFPGPDGGTCINEAAIVAAGFEYRKVTRAADCPPCFSRPLSSYLLALNDAMPPDVRQRLMPFVLRLSGSADTVEVEFARVELIVVQTVRRIVSAALAAGAGTMEHAVRCANVTTIGEAFIASNSLALAHPASTSPTTPVAPYAARLAANLAFALAAFTSHVAAAHAAHAAVVAAAMAGPGVWDTCIEIAEEAFAIGNQASACDTALVVERMRAAKRLVPA